MNPFLFHQNKAMAARASKNMRHNIARSITPEVGESRHCCGATSAGLYFKMQLSEFCHPTSAPNIKSTPKGKMSTPHFKLFHLEDHKQCLNLANIVTKA
jgi:hypothetical protein